MDRKLPKPATLQRPKIGLNQFHKVGQVRPRQPRQHTPSLPRVERKLFPNQSLNRRILTLTQILGGLDGFLLKVRPRNPLRIKNCWQIGLFIRSFLRVIKLQVQPLPE